MLFMVHARQAPALSENQLAQLAQAMDVFFAAIPSDVRVIFDYIKADRSGSYSVIEVPNRAALDRIMVPYDGLVEATITEVFPGPQME